MRPEHLKLSSSFWELVAGRLDLVERLGEYAFAHITKDNGTEFAARLERRPEERSGAELRFTTSPENIHAFSSESGQRLA